MGKFDCIVVGSGMAGCKMAADLAAGGLRVAVVEAGPLRTAADVLPRDPRPTTAMERWRFAWEGQPVQSRNVQFARHNRGFYVNDRTYPYLASGPFLWFRGRQVGGRSILWSRVAMRMSDHEFHPYPGASHWENWPFGHSELAPWYARVERDLGVRGETAYCVGLPDGEYVGPAAFSPLLKTLRGRLEDNVSGLRCLPARTARLERSVMPVTLMQAVRAGATLIADAAVVRVIVGPGTRRASGVEAMRPDGSRFLIDGGCVILCASTIESVRILWQSAGPDHPRGIGNHSDLLGRGIQDHLAVSCSGWLAADLRGRDHPLVPEPDDPWQEDPAHLLVWGREHRRMGTTDGGNASAVDGLAHLTLVQASAKWSLLVIGASRSDPANRITVRSVPGQPLPVPMIACERTDDDFDRLDSLARLAKRIVRTGGLGPPGRTWSRRLAHMIAPDWMLRRSRYLPGAVIHETGGARMGTRPAESVVDPWGCCWDADNVFVADGSVFPNSGFQNPTLTILALSARTAAHVLETRGRWRRGSEGGVGDG